MLTVTLRLLDLGDFADSKFQWVSENYIPKCFLHCIHFVLETAKSPNFTINNSTLLWQGLYVTFKISQNKICVVKNIDSLRLKLCCGSLSAYEYWHLGDVNVVLNDVYYINPTIIIWDLNWFFSQTTVLRDGLSSHFYGLFL